MKMSNVLQWSGVSRLTGVVAMGSVLVLVGCSSTDPKPESIEAPDGSTYPQWYLDQDKDAEPMVIYGYGVSAAEPDYPGQMRRMARTQAAQEVAEQLEQTLSALNSEYFDRQDIGRDNDAQTRSQVRQSTEQFLDAQLIGLEYDRHDVDGQGRWYARARFDLEQDFDAYVQALGLDPSAEAARDLRGSAEEHLSELQERRNEGPDS